MNTSSVHRNPNCYFLYEANVRGLEVRNQNEHIKVKSGTSPLLQIHIHHQMCDLALFKINMEHRLWSRDPTPTPHVPPARTLTRGLQHVN